MRLAKAFFAMLFALVVFAGSFSDLSASSTVTTTVRTMTAANGSVFTVTNYQTVTETNTHPATATHTSVTTSVRTLTAANGTVITATQIQTHVGTSLEPAPHRETAKAKALKRRVEASRKRFDRLQARGKLTDGDIQKLQESMAGITAMIDAADADGIVTSRERAAIQRAIQQMDMEAAMMAHGAHAGQDEEEKSTTNGGEWKVKTIAPKKKPGKSGTGTAQ